VLRDLALFCSHRRHQIVTTTREEQVSASKEEQIEEQVAAFNLFICLVAKYFDQSDLADIES
jgi:hypothetical protein